MVTNLIRGVRKHKYDLFCTACNALKTYCETVTRQNRKNNAERSLGELCGDIGCDLINRCVIALCTRHNSLCNGNNVLVAYFYIFALCSIENALCHNSSYIISLTNNRSSDTARDGTNKSFFHFSNLQKCIDISSISLYYNIYH